MSFNEKMYALGSKRSIIREIFEYCKSRAKEIGADAVDMDLLGYSVIKEESIYAESDEKIEEYFRGLKSFADSLGIEIGQTHGRIRGFKNIPEDDELLLRDARLDCLATAALGAPYCVMHTTTSINMGADPDPALMRKLNFDMFKGILPHAKKYGIKIATETFGDAVKFSACDFFGNMEQFMGGFEDVAALTEYADNFCVCMDTGHTNKATRYGNPTAAEAIRLLGKRIECLHLNDNDTLTDQHKIPMTGTINWSEVFDALDEIGYKGNYNMELAYRTFGDDFEYEEAAFAIKVMRKILSDRYGE